MNEVVKAVADKVGISQDQAQKAVDVVVNYLKQRLPASLSGQLDSALAGGSGGAGEAAKAIGTKLGL
jgi:hypothetical protein